MLYNECLEKEIEAYIELSIKKEGSLLDFIEITLWNNEHTIDLMLCQVLDCRKNKKCNGRCLECNFTTSAFTVFKYSKNNFHGFSVETDSINKAKQDGRKLYYKYRKKYPLKRNLKITN